MGRRHGAALAMAALKAIESRMVRKAVGGFDQNRVLLGEDSTDIFNARFQGSCEKRVSNRVAIRVLRRKAQRKRAFPIS